MASSSQSTRSPGVYLSFYGPDLDPTFLPHLRYSLCKETDLELYAAFPMGEDATSSRFKAIKFAIVIFSKNYARSSWCLNELRIIIELKEQNKLTAIPIFFRVSPKEVRLRGEEGCYQIAMEEMEAKYGKDNFKSWKAALWKASVLIGFDLREGSEAEIIKSVVGLIDDLLGQVHLEVRTRQIRVPSLHLDDEGDRRSYDVFLSFRGPDTRHTIISHLYRALCQKGVLTFKDSSELEAGQKRSQLFEALEQSRIAIVMFSENYARSKWCLQELGNIIELMQLNKLTLIPIFYRVSPEEVRLHEKNNGEKGCYQIAMDEMEAKYDNDNSNMVESWKKALWKAGDLIGFVLPEGEDEGNCVEEVVEKVMKILNRVPLEVAQFPIGINGRLKEVRPLLKLDPHLGPQK